MPSAIAPDSDVAADLATRRQATLDALEILDTLPEQSFDDLANLARALCDTSMAVISLADRDRQWFKARIGISLMQVSRQQALCEHVIAEPAGLVVVPDARCDPRFSASPFVTEDPFVRFFAGVPLRSPDGIPIGALCVLDSEPRAIDPLQREGLAALARQAGALFELQLKTLQLQRSLADRDYLARRMQAQQVDLEQRNRELHERASQDGLTGLCTRGELERIQADPASAAALFGEPYSIAMIDLDNFKRINDEHGHGAGDDALRQVAGVIADCVRGQDIAARYGGEEFLVLMPGTPLGGARTVIERICRRVRGLALPFPLTLSAGLAAGRPDQDQPRQIVQRADQALYLAKHGGRDRVVAYEE